MSSSVCETWGWVVEEVAPDVLVTLDENAPISAPIKLGRWLLCADAAAAPSRERVSLSWVTSIDRLFWKPVLTPVLHGSLSSALPVAL